MLNKIYEKNGGTFTDFLSVLKKNPLCGKEKFRKFLFPVFLLLLLGCTSCGYRMGSMMHPQIKTVAIAPVKNNTREVLASITMRRQLEECFMRDGSLKLTSMERADCIVYCQINTVTQSAIAWDDDDEDRPFEFRLTTTGTFTVLMPGRTVPLVKSRVVSGSCNYQFLTDPAIGKENGLMQACRKMAEMVVQYTTEAW